MASCIINRKNNHPIENWSADDFMYYILSSCFWPVTMILIIEIKTGIISKTFIFFVKERRFWTDKKNEKS